MHDLILNSLLAGFALVVMLSMVMASRNLMLVLANMPFALAGGILAVVAGGGWMSIGSIVGFVT